MKKTLKNILTSALVFLIAAALPLMQSCGLVKINGRTPTTDVTETSSGTTEDIPTPIERTGEYAKKQESFFAAIGDANYGGADFLVMSSIGKDCLTHDGTTVYSSAVYERNGIVSEKYGVRLAELSVNREMMLTELLSSVASSSYYADLLIIPADMVGLYAVRDGVMNLKSVPFLDLTAEYFSASSVDASTYAGRTYAAAGDASLARDDLACVYFSKDMSDKLGIANMYSLAANGEWTWERFFEITRLLDGYNADLTAQGGDAVYAYSAESFGDDFADAVFHSSGETYLTRKDGDIALSSSLESGSALLGYLSGMNSAYRYDGGDAAVSFADGRTAFMFDTLGTAGKLTDSPTDWGILPFPSVGGRGTYLAPDKAAVFAVPKGTADSEKSGVIMSALNAASYGALNEAYLRHALDRVIRDNETAAMIEMILASVVYDPAAALAPAFPAVYDATYGISYKSAHGIEVSEWERSYAAAACIDALKNVNGR